MARQLRARPSFSDIFDQEEVPVAVEEEARERLAQIAGKHENRTIPFLPWNDQVPVPGVGSLDFEQFPFQREWYSDEVTYAKRGTCTKCTQAGASEWMARWAMFFPDTRGDTAMYVFPSNRQLKDYSDMRIRQLIRESPYLRRRIPWDYVDNKLLKQIGYGWLVARGSQEAADLESVAADEVVLDEYDLLVQKNIPSAEKRLSAPTSRNLLRRIGWPTYSEFGIHGHFLRSDAREWLVKCTKCRKELPLHFFPQDGRTHHYLDAERMSMVCANCEMPIGRDVIAAGRWVAEHPGRAAFGFHVSRLMVPSANYEEIVEESKLTRPYQVETFWRKTLGLPFDTAEGRLSREAIMGAVSAGGNYMQAPWDAGYNGAGLVTAGIDVASVRNLNVRISEHLNETTKRALFIGEVDSFEKLETILIAYRVKCACIDHQPEGRAARGLANKLRGIVFLHNWTDAVKQAISVDEEMGTVVTHRTTVIDATLDMIRKKVNWLPVNLPEDYIPHLRAPVKFQEEDEVTGVMRVGYRVETAHDYMQAEAYDVAATETWWALHLKGNVSRDEVLRLDEMIGYDHTTVGEYGNMDYSPGPAYDEPEWGKMREPEDDLEDEFGFIE